MKQGLSIIITIRGDEPKTLSTIANIRERAGCPVEITAVYDGTPHDPGLPVDQIRGFETPRGIGPARDRGIQDARYAVVMLIDAHMHFEKGFGAKILKHFRKKSNHKDVTCGQCIPSMLDLSPAQNCPHCKSVFGADLNGDIVTCPTCKKDFPVSKGYTGARFSLKSEESGGEKWCLSGKWSDQKVESEIGCVYGACYAFRRAWYNKIGAPLAMLKGWGGDEEYLSMASWLAGGRCYLLDYWVSHLFKDKPSFAWTRQDNMYPTLNRVRLLDLFPGPEPLQEDLYAWTALNIKTADQDFCNIYDADKVRPEVIEAKKLWFTWAPNAQKFLDDWVDYVVEPLETRTAKRAEARPWKQTTAAVLPPGPRVQRRKYITCANCGRKSTFRVDRTVNRPGEVLVRYGKCNNPACGIRGVLVNRPDGQVMYWGRDAENFSF